MRLQTQGQTGTYTRRCDRDKEVARQKWSGKAAGRVGFGKLPEGERRGRRTQSRSGSVYRTRQRPVTDSRAEGETGARKVRGGCFTRILECQAQGGGFGHVGNTETAKALEGERDRKQWCFLPSGRLI